jgi:hypothetical protein
MSFLTTWLTRWGPPALTTSRTERWRAVLGALTFTTDSMVAGRYNVTGTATGYTTQSTNPVVDLGMANSNTVKDLVLTP